MKKTDLNKYILNYIKYDKTNSAIMLSAPWGTGKSYYIQNSLVPFLNENGYETIIVSLYGLDSINDISRSIYLETRFKIKSKHKEALASAKILGKTIANGVASFWGINLNSTKEKDLLKLYESIDLSNKLVILEDIERTEIDILKVLGYVNNLVEHDNVKALLVANETELLNKGNDNYKRIKEKTIGDTILFENDEIECISQIMHGFNNVFFEKMLLDKDEFDNSKISNEIYNKIMRNKGINNYNLRSFIFACQKSNDLLRCFNENEYYDLDFLKALFLGNVVFAFKYKKDEEIKWPDGNSDKSFNLGIDSYPVYKLGFIYIKYQILEEEILKSYCKFFTYLKRQEIINTRVNENLNVLYHCFDYSEKEVNLAIEELIQQISNGSVNISDFETISNYLYALKDTLTDNQNIDICLTKIKEVLKNSNIDSGVMFKQKSGIMFLSSKTEKEYEKYCEELEDILKSRKQSKVPFSYDVNQVDDFCNYCYEHSKDFANENTFIKRFDLDKLISLLNNCTVKNVVHIRQIFLNIYSGYNLKEIFYEDDKLLEILKDKLKTIKKDDKIYMQQIEWFINNIDDILSKFGN